jgi:hypothetical protein
MLQQQSGLVARLVDTCFAQGFRAVADQGGRCLWPIL